MERRTLHPHGQSSVLHTVSTAQPASAPTFGHLFCVVQQPPGGAFLGAFVLLPPTRPRYSNLRKRSPPLSLVRPQPSTSQGRVYAGGQDMPRLHSSPSQSTAPRPSLLSPSCAHVREGPPASPEPRLHFPTSPSVTTTPIPPLRAYTQTHTHTKPCDRCH